MGREVRRVPANWEHPKENGQHVPLLSGYGHDAKEFRELTDEKGLEYAMEYFGRKPDPDSYMSEWPEEEKTHYQMYETCSEGTPISPVMDTPEKLARWLADTGASAFADLTATYEAWLNMITGPGSSISAVICGGQTQSGVEAMNSDS